MREQLYGYFMQQTGEISHEKARIWQRKGNIKKKTESVLIADACVVHVKKDETMNS